MMDGQNAAMMADRARPACRLLPLDPHGGPGAQTSGTWLTQEMRRRGLSNTELFRRIRGLGFEGTREDIVSMWRTDRCHISLDVLPLLLEALEIPGDERPRWAVHFLQAVHPRLVACMGGR